MNFLHHAVAVAFIAGLSTTVGVHAEDASAGQCIRMNDVDHTKVIDGKTILVAMKRDAYKRIDLATRCVGLAVEEAFAFSMQTYELCRSTPLHVLNGGTCIIDKIVDIDKDAAKALRAQKK